MEWGHDDDTERWISDDGNEAGAESARSNSAEDWLRKYRCSAMTSTASESHLADCCERLLDLVGEAAELLQAKANNYFDSDLARTATSLVDISYQLRREILVEKAMVMLANALLQETVDPCEAAKPFIQQIQEIEQAYKDYQEISGTDDFIEI
jgi:hypothetical protein